MLYLNAKITVQTQAFNVIGVNDLLQNSLLCNTIYFVSFLCFYVEGGNFRVILFHLLPPLNHSFSYEVSVVIENKATINTEFIKRASLHVYVLSTIVETKN